MGRLAPRQRQLLHALLSTPAPSYQQIAAQMSISIGSIGPTRLRALRRLRLMLREQLDGPDLGLSA